MRCQTGYRALVCACYQVPSILLVPLTAGAGHGTHRAGHGPEQPAVPPHRPCSQQKVALEMP